MAMNNKTKAGVGLTGGALAAALALVVPWEGRETTGLKTPDGKVYVAYQDIVGVWTACDGITRGIKKNDRFTGAECDAMLAPELELANSYINRCITVPLSDGERGTYVSAGYNLGQAVMCGWSRAQYLKNPKNKPENCRAYTLNGEQRCASNVQFALNAGRREEACRNLLSWSNAGGKFVQGLYNRRMDEMNTCLKAVRESRS